MSDIFTSVVLLAMGKVMFRGMVTLLTLVISLSLAGAAQAQAENERQALFVRLDEATLLRLGMQAQTMVIGNPSIADAVVNDGKTIVITGKSFGTTNLIALDRRGEIIIERQVWVQPPSVSILTVQRGDEQETYSCSPQCRRTAVIGDTNKNFADIVNQAQTRNGLAQSQATSR